MITCRAAGLWPNSSHENRITNTGIAYCSTMALAEVVSFVAAMNSMPVAPTPMAPSSVPFVTFTLGVPRAAASSAAATSERTPLMVTLFQGSDLLNTPAKLQLAAASATWIAPRRDLVIPIHIL